MWKKLVFKIGQVFGIGAMFFMIFILLKEPWHEPNELIRWGEIIGSGIAALLLIIDFFDLMPEFD